MKIRYVASLALLAATSCAEPKSPTATAAAGEVAISNGKLVLPAVSGNPAAAYFTLTNGTAETVSLAAVSVEGSVKSEMHQTSSGSMSPITTLNMGPGASVSFERGGKHVMVFNPARSLKPGASAKLTVTFSGGKTASAPLAVESAGGDMAGMEH